jgi:uncharacterized protein
MVACIGTSRQVCYNAPMTFIVDGHNLIGQIHDLALDDPDDEEKLVERLRRFHARTGRSIVVVFDPGGGFHLMGKQSVGAVEVVHVGTGITADEVIVQRVLTARDPRDVTVVTSDREVQTAVRHSGAAIVESADFAKQVSGGARRRPPRRKKRRGAVSASAPLPEAEVREWMRIFSQTERD